MATIKLVQGDNLPMVRIKLTDDMTALPLDLTSAVVVIKFRAKGSTEVLTTIPTTVTDGPGGEVEFFFPGITLSVPAGPYEGEIEVSFGPLVQTVFKPLNFLVRAQF